MNNELHWFLSYHIPEEQRFAPFDTAHFVYLFGGIFLIIALALIVRKVDKKRAELIIRISAVGLLLFYFVRAYLFANYFWNYHFLDLVPLHLCIVSGFVLPLTVFTKNKLLWNLSYSVLMPGAFVAIITPENTLNFYHAYGWMPLVFFLWHVLVVAIPVMQVASGELIPDMKTFPKVLLVLAGYAVFVYIFNRQMNTNFLYLNRAARGTALEVFENWLGNPGYLIPMVLLVVFVCFLMFVPWYLMERRRG